MWRKGIFTSVTVIQCKSDRIVAIQASVGDREIVIISVYMPIDREENLPIFTECMSEITAIIDSCQVESTYVLGDFNAHPKEHFWRELISFSNDQQWICADAEMLGLDSSSYTYISDAHGSSRWLDHVIVTEQAWRSVIKAYISYDVVWSDHFPLTIKCNLETVIPKTKLNISPCNKIIWGQREADQIKKYYEMCNSKLKNIDFPDNFRYCSLSKKICQDKDHRQIIRNLYLQIVAALQKGAILTYSGKETFMKGRTIIGWNKHVKEVHQYARMHFKTWLIHGRPRSGRVYDQMRYSRNVFKNKLKWVQNNQEQIKMDIVASHRASKNFSKFWNETRKLNLSPKKPYNINGLNVSTEIANMFMEHFKVKSAMDAKSQISVAEPQVIREIIGFTAKEVKSVIKDMKRGKSPGHDGLCIEHVVNAGKHLPRVLAMLYSLCVRHSYLPDEMMRTVVVPLVKNKTGDISDKSNYRPISLATVLAKVFDGLMDRCLSSIKNLNDAQFGFRPGLSTEAAILCLKNTIKYYTDRKTPVYACFLDLTKAFDMLSYDIMWRKLKDIGLRPELIAIFRYWYGNQMNNVKWSDAWSEPYRLECGVRQGGITSPTLFNIYINGLIEELSRQHMGCHIDDVCMNSISYADDMVLLSPSVSALTSLIKVCESYAEAHGLKYNVGKSQLLVFRAGKINPKIVPPIRLSSVPLKRVTEFKYLGHIVNEMLSDDSDIERERRALAIRGNMLARRFARCSVEAKITLFKSYCQVFYTSSLWIKYTKSALGALRVQYNNAFRMLLGLPRFCSASGMFAGARTNDFYAIMRVKASSIMHRMRKSTNNIVRVFAERFDSPFTKHWVKVLINNNSVIV